MNEPSALETIELILGTSVILYGAYNAKRIARYITKGLEEFTSCYEDKNLASKTKDIK